MDTTDLPLEQRTQKNSYYGTELLDFTVARLRKNKTRQHRKIECVECRLSFNFDKFANVSVVENNQGVLGPYATILEAVDEVVQEFAIIFEIRGRTVPPPMLASIKRNLLQVTDCRGECNLHFHQFVDNVDVNLTASASICVSINEEQWAVVCEDARIRIEHTVDFKDLVQNEQFVRHHSRDPFAFLTFRFPHIFDWKPPWKRSVPN